MCLVFFQAEDGIRDYKVTGVQTCALPIWLPAPRRPRRGRAGPGSVGTWCSPLVWFGLALAAVRARAVLAAVRTAAARAGAVRSEERRVGKERTSRVRPENRSTTRGTTH